MGKTKCPRCHRFFEDDFDRYVVGTATNTLKFGVNMVCRLSGSALGGFLGNTMGKIGGKVGGAIASTYRTKSLTWRISSMLVLR